MIREIKGDPGTTDYNELENVPTNVSAFNNDVGYLTQHQDISGKVDKIEGKSLSTNDYTTQEKNKLAELENYDDTQVRQLITQTNANFSNYYTKSESYSANEVDTLLRTQRQGQYVVVATLPIASADTMFKIYLVPSTGPQPNNIKDEYVTLENNGSYSWEKIGSTSVDLSNYSTTTEMNTAITTALLNYYTKLEVDTALGNKQDIIQDLTTIRNGATAGATAYQKPINGIPKNDLSESIQTSLNKADTALQSHQDISSKEDITNKKTAITSNELSSTYYPTIKAVADYVHQQTAQWGVVSQTQTWTQASDGGYDYTMSNLVYGWIPQANIDLFTVAGATFNTTTGYFELNGLTDISYKEMMLIYEFGDVLKVDHQLGSFSVDILLDTTLPSLRTFLAEPHYGNSQWAQQVNFGISMRGSNIEVISPYAFFYKPRMRAWSLAPYELDTSTSSPARYLKKFINVNVGFQTNAKSLFAPSLEDFEVYNIKFGWDLSQSSRLNASSIAICINNAANTSAITITLHATAYTRAIADSDVQAALEAHPTITLASA